MFYIDKIKQLPQHVQKSILSNATNTKIITHIPTELKFLIGGPNIYIDFGFHYFNNYNKLITAFLGSGVGIPNHNYQFRLLPTGYTVIETKNASTILPQNWKEAITITDQYGKVILSGKLINQHLVKNI